MCPDLASMDPAFIDKVVRDTLGSPSQLGQSWVNLLIQEADALTEKSSLLLRESSNNPGKIKVVTCVRVRWSNENFLG